MREPAAPQHLRQEDWGAARAPLIYNRRLVVSFSNLYRWPSPSGTVVDSGDYPNCLRRFRSGIRSSGRRGTSLQGPVLFFRRRHRGVLRQSGGCVRAHKQDQRTSAAQSRLACPGASGVTVAMEAAGSRQAGEAFRQSEARCRELANVNPRMSWMPSASGMLLRSNRRWFGYTGTTTEQMKGVEWRLPSSLPCRCAFRRAGSQAGLTLE